MPTRTMDRIQLKAKPPSWTSFESERSKAQAKTMKHVRTEKHKSWDCAKTKNINLIL